MFYSEEKAYGSGSDEDEVVAPLPSITPQLKEVAICKRLCEANFLNESTWVALAALQREFSRQ